MRERRLTTPISEETARDLRAGDVVYLTGAKIIVVPFAVSAEPLLASVEKGEPMFDLPGSVIYHSPYGFTKENDEYKVRWVGATTSAMTESLAPTFLKLGVRALMGKGGMGDIALQSMQEHGAVYLATVGAGASVLARGVTRIVKMVDPHLWLSELEVKEFGPVIVALDAHGHNLFDENWDNARKIAAALSSERT